jgi:hypothetical protein
LATAAFYPASAETSGEVAQWVIEPPPHLPDTQGSWMNLAAPPVASLSNLENIGDVASIMRVLGPDASQMQSREKRIG